ncbi:PhzF family phenazine biosynthesis protein [Egicoccus halophilus]|uniref:Isomerase n=1 Tax=Egicoccus halophilus TaxID=1670830 RepID=A0A8J3EVM6_9ACTN|nr:PhzF family phenazine biosynthesis protein [Egicoccus halophilus]GGI08434.1 isomerase [Egicoccus halophilus]
MPPFRLVDAFAEQAFAGNPAGVVLLERPQPVAWMQAVATEVNASETAFLVRSEPDGDTWRLRWFTPTTEVDLCGHATLAAAHVLWQDARAPADATLRFATRSGVLTATAEDRVIWLDLPAWPVRTHPEPSRLASALGAAAGRYVGRSAGNVDPSGASQDDQAQANDVVVLDHERAVHELAPDLAEVARLGSGGLIVTAPSDGDDDFVSRYFAPALGVPEDPVTGSAHATLGPWWAQELGRDTLTARQLSRRGGHLRVRVVDDRVHVGGAAVTVISGALAD